MTIHRAVQPSAGAAIALSVILALPACDDGGDDDSASDDDGPLAGFVAFSPSDDADGDASAYAADIRQGYHRVDGDRLEFIVQTHEAVDWTLVDISVWVVDPALGGTVTLTSNNAQPQLWLLLNDSWTIDSNPASYGVDTSDETMLRFFVDYVDIELGGDRGYGVGITAGSLGAADFHDKMPDGLLADDEFFTATLIPAS